MDIRSVPLRMPGWRLYRSLARSRSLALVRPLGPSRSPRRSLSLVAAATLAAAMTGTTLAQASPVAADTPTGPPPVTILTQGANNDNGDIFIAPFGDTSSYANEIGRAHV